jgi:C-terminal processing protease CtpA/Prc
MPSMRTLIVAALCAASLQALDPGTIDSTVRGAADIFAAEYFDVPVATRVSAELKRRLEAGQYATLPTNQALAARLTRDLFELTRDKHVTVEMRRTASGGGGAVQRRDVPTTDGFRRTEILPGNIGLLDMAFFMRPIEHKDALAAAMQVLQPADALILDMRQNGGGNPGTVALLISYLLDEPGRPIFEIRPRTGATTVYVTETPGLPARNGNRPVYVLTSKQSFSGGEGLGFLLQDIKRALVIGEVTAGAANPGRGYPINDLFEITVPNGQLLTSVSRRNWEGGGVTPDVPVPAADALRVAHLRAIDDLMAATPSGPKRDELARVRARINAQ